MAEAIAEADECLKQKKGFGNLSAGTQQRRMFAGLLAIRSLDADRDASAAVSTAVAVQTALEIQMQVCMMLMMSSSAAAASAST